MPRMDRSILRALARAARVCTGTELVRRRFCGAAFWLGDWATRTHRRQLHRSSFQRAARKCSSGQISMPSSRGGAPPRQTRMPRSTRIPRRALRRRFRWACGADLVAMASRSRQRGPNGGSPSDMADFTMIAIRHGRFHDNRHYGGHRDAAFGARRPARTLRLRYGRRRGRRARLPRPARVPRSAQA